MDMFVFTSMVMAVMTMFIITVGMAGMGKGINACNGKIGF